ncbi:MAG: hypothetical protein JWN43_4856 [Gammaproteobacteria bacterium]|jgi:hypothetical protein|nr:hypothetical protein [Gammaproteobacteria bacterium]
MKTSEQKEIAALKKEVRQLKLLLQEATSLLRKIMDFADKYEDLEIPATPVQKRHLRRKKQKAVAKKGH